LDCSIRTAFTSGIQVKNAGLNAVRTLLLGHVLLMVLLQSSGAFGSSLDAQNGCSDCGVLDIDENGETNALSDGLLVIRYLFGFTGEALTFNAIDNPNQEVSAEDVTNRLKALNPLLDVDADGEIRALTDGLLIIRSLFGFTDEALTSGSLGDKSKRRLSNQIEDYLTCLSDPNVDISIDTDGDGSPDCLDLFPIDASEIWDTDGDGLGNELDLDDDGDAIVDSDDEFPLLNLTEIDSDSDGVADAFDAFPLNASETKDTDFDGIGNNEDLDDDGDGVSDDLDVAPLDPDISEPTVVVSGKKEYAVPEYFEDLEIEVYGFDDDSLILDLEMPIETTTYLKMGVEDRKIKIIRNNSRPYIVPPGSFSATLTASDERGTVASTEFQIRGNWNGEGMYGGFGWSATTTLFVSPSGKAYISRGAADQIGKAECSHGVGQASLSEGLSGKTPLYSWNMALGVDDALCRSSEWPPYQEGVDTKAPWTQSFGVSWNGLDGWGVEPFDFFPTHYNGFSFERLFESQNRLANSLSYKLDWQMKVPMDFDGLYIPYFDNFSVDYYRNAFFAFGLVIENGAIRPFDLSKYAEVFDFIYEYEIDWPTCATHGKILAIDDSWGEGFPHKSLPHLASVELRVDDCNAMDIAGELQVESQAYRIGNATTSTSEGLLVLWPDTYLGGTDLP